MVLGIIDGEKSRIIPFRPRRRFYADLSEDGRVPRRFRAGLGVDEWKTYLSAERRRVLTGSPRLDALNLDPHVADPLIRAKVYTVGGLRQLLDMGGRPYGVGRVRTKTARDALALYEQQSELQEGDLGTRPKDISPSWAVGGLLVPLIPGTKSDTLTS